MLSPLKKLISKSYETPKITTTSNDNNKPYNFQKDFNGPVKGNDFLKLKDDQSKNLGFFDDVKTLLYKKNKKIYYVKGIEKKKLINSSYQKVLNYIYKINNDKSKNINVFDFIINLQTNWEENEQIFLVFDGIQKYTLFENLLKNNSQNITEENIIIIFRQILEAVNCLHDNNIFGCDLYINSFIYDKYSQTIKLTDLGFSKICKNSKNINDNKLENGFEFNDYYPPEYISKMTDTLSIYDSDQLKNANYDIWQLGVLFYKIATFGKSPFGEEKDENLKESIMNKKINYTPLNKYSPKIVQIIDKMIQVPQSSRISLKHLLNLEPFKTINKIPLLNIISHNNERPVSLSMVNKEKEKGKDIKILMTSSFENKEETINNIENTENEEDIDKNIGDKKFINNNKDILNKIKIQGNLVKDLNSMVSQEIYPDGSILPIFKKKFLNKFNNIDKNLVFDLSNKLSLLEKEYKKLDENKLAVYNITNYVNDNIKELNTFDSENIESLIKKFNNLKISKIETNILYEEIVRNKDEFNQDKYKALISNLIYEIKLLEIELEQEKNQNQKLRKKIKELGKRNLEIKNECQDKVDFYEKKIDLLEEVVFNTDKNAEQDLKQNYDNIYQALYNSIKDFTELNIKLKQNLEESLVNFREGKKNWLQEIIDAKIKFRNEIQHYLQRAIERPKIYYLSKKENQDSKDSKDYLNNNKNNEAIIEELKREKNELLDLINEQKTTINNSTTLYNDLKKEIRLKDDKIEELLRFLNYKENSKLK